MKRIITIITKKGKSTRAGESADEHLKKLPIKLSTHFIKEVVRKLKK